MVQGTIARLRLEPRAQDRLCLLVAACRPIEVGEIDVGGGEAGDEADRLTIIPLRLAGVPQLHLQRSEVHLALGAIRVELLRLAVLDKRGIEACPLRARELARGSRQEARRL